MSAPSIHRENVRVGSGRPPLLSCMNLPIYHERQRRGSAAEALAPPSLRTTLRDRAAALATRYARVDMAGK